MKQSRKILLTSLMTIAASTSLIAGATYALFTSEDSHNVAIQAGTVKVLAEIGNVKLYSRGIEMADTFQNGGTASLSPTGELTLTNITPGDKVEFELSLDNQSNVAIAYQTFVKKVSDEGLYSGLVITVDGKKSVTSVWSEVAAETVLDQKIKVSVELPLEAGNEYLGKSAVLAAGVKAVQGNGEKDPAIVYSSGVNKLDLNELGIYQASGFDGAVSAQKGAKVEINGDGTLIGEETDSYAMAVWATGEGSEVVINGGYYTQSITGSDDDYDLIYASNGGDIIINGGEFRSVKPRMTLNVRDADYQSGASTITVTGGRFYEFNPAESYSEGVTPVSFVAPGYKSVKDTSIEGETWYEVVPMDFYMDTVNKVATISSAAGLFEFASLVNTENPNDGNDFNEYTVKLIDDIDLENAEWTPIGQTGATQFLGVFDGQGHTIKNLNINSTDSEVERGGNYSSGLFGWVENHGESVEIKNLIIDGATVVGHHNVGVVVGFFSGENALLQNIVVKDAKVSASHYDSDACGDKVGAIAGAVAYSAKAINCDVFDSTVKGSRDVAQCVGSNTYSKEISGCDATDVVVSRIENDVCNDDSAGNNIKNEPVGRVLQ